MSSHAPLVSVVIPTYKRQSQLRQAINSVDEQTYDNIEIIVVDDDPASELRETALDLGAQKYIQHSENRGVSYSRNDGIRASDGEYVAFLDDDDLWMRNKIEKQVELLTASDETYGMVYGGYHVENPSGGRKTVVPDTTGDVYDNLLEQNFVSTPTVMVKSECFDEVGLFDESLDFGEDWEMWLRIAKQYHVGVVREPLAVICQDHSDRLSLDWETRYRSTKQIMDAYREDLIRLDSAASRRYRLYAVTCLHTGREREALDYLILSIRYQADWLSILYLILLLIDERGIRQVLELRERVRHSGFSTGIRRWIREIDLPV